MRYEFEAIFPILVAALILVGMPAIILKQSTVWFLRSGDGPRLRLLWSSIGLGAASGVATILLYAWLSSGRAFTAHPVFFAIPAVELATAVVLLALVAVADGLLWRSFVESQGEQPVHSAPLWLIGGNVWIPWALVLMHFWQQSNGLVD